MSVPSNLPRRLSALVWRWRLPIFVLCVAVFCYGAFRPEPPPEIFVESDKVMHLAAFGGLGLCSALAAHGHRHLERIVWPLLVAAAPLTEWLQHVLQPSTRNFSLGDIAANLAGVALAALLWRLAGRWLRME